MSKTYIFHGYIKVPVLVTVEADDEEQGLKLIKAHDNDAVLDIQEDDDWTFDLTTFEADPDAQPEVFEDEDEDD